MTATELIAYYQQKVDSIPDVRPLVMLHEEVMLEILTYLNYYHKRHEDDNLLMKSCMIIAKGHMNPAFVKDAVTQWKTTK